MAQHSIDVNVSARSSKPISAPTAGSQLVSVP
jgi:hypothetical protein